MADKKFATGTSGTGMTSGTSFNPRTNETTANPYEKKLVSQPNVDTFLVNYIYFWMIFYCAHQSVFTFQSKYSF